MRTLKKSKLLLTALIFTIIHLFLTLFVTITLAFNLFGVVDAIDILLSQMSQMGVGIDYYLTTYYFELALSFLVNFSCAKLYYKGYKYGAMGEVFGRRVIMNSIMQMLFSAMLPGIFALIAGMVLSKSRKIVTSSVSDSEEYFNRLKLEAMSEAVTRLKELRASGAISEEEYYANINKILES